MLTRMRALAAKRGTVAAVTPQNWMFLGGYKKLREALLAQASVTLVGALGPRCFETISGEVVNAALVVLTEAQPDAKTVFAGLDANCAPDPAGKAAVLHDGEVLVLRQAQQRADPDGRLVLGERSEHAPLKGFADSRWGLRTSDSPRLIGMFWEFDLPRQGWHLLQSSTASTTEVQCSLSQHHNTGPTSRSRRTCTQRTSPRPVGSRMDTVLAAHRI